MPAPVEHDAASADGLWIIAGLGNPGIEYAFTPHNCGFLLVDELAQRAAVRVERRECQALTGRARLAGHSVLLAKPETFMNLSGIAVKSLLAKYDCPLPRLLVVSDDFDLPLGALRLRPRGSAGTHNGLRSVVGLLGPEFPRLRLGIHPGHPIRDAARFVTSPWRKADLPAVGRMLERAGDAVETLLRAGCARAMSLYNAPPAADAGAAGDATGLGKE